MSVIVFPGALVVDRRPIAVAHDRRVVSRDLRVGDRERHSLRAGADGSLLASPELDAVDLGQRDPSLTASAWVLRSRAGA
jgi:hypothetical protein